MRSRSRESERSTRKSLRGATSEPMSRSASNQSSTSSGSDSKSIKQEVKTETNDEQILVHHEKRKFQDIAGLDKIKLESSDAEMEYAPSDSASNTMNGGSGRSTPAAIADASRKSSTPSGETSNGTNGVVAPPPGDVIGGMSMAKPKIRRRPREPPNPFIKNKKPRKG